MIVSLPWKGISLRDVHLTRFPQKAHYRGNLSGIQKLETFNILDFPKNMVSKVTDTVVAAAKMGIKFGRINRVLREIGAKRDHFTLLRELDKVGQCLAELNIMLYRNFTSCLLPTIRSIL